MEAADSTSNALINRWLIATVFKADRDKVAEGWREDEQGNDLERCWFKPARPDTTESQEIDQRE